jgi:hypothetical protein
MVEITIDQNEDAAIKWLAARANKRGEILI